MGLAVRGLRAAQVLDARRGERRRGAEASASSELGARAASRPRARARTRSSPTASSASSSWRWRSPAARGCCCSTSPRRGCRRRSGSSWPRSSAALPRTLTLMLIEHDMDLALSLVDWVTCLNNGQVLVEGSPPAIRDNSEVQDVYLGKRRTMLEIANLHQLLRRRACAARRVAARGRGRSSRCSAATAWARRR